MVLWILIYSFFETPNFNDEVIILFSEVSFWATVIVSVVIALGMHSSVMVRQSTDTTHSSALLREVLQERVHATGS